MRYLAVLFLILGLGAVRLHAQAPTVTIFSSSNDEGVPVFCGMENDILVSGRITPVNALTLGGTYALSVVQTEDYQGGAVDYDASNPAPNNLLLPAFVSINSSLGLFTLRVFYANHADYAIVRYRVSYTLVTGQVISADFQTASYDLNFNVPAFAAAIPTCANPVELNNTVTPVPADFQLSDISFSGPGVTVTNGEPFFNPNAAGVGTHTIVATANYRGCALSKSLQVTVTQTPNPEIIGVPQTVCKLAEDEVRVGLRLSPLYIDETDSPFTAEHQTTEAITPLTVEPVEGTDSVYVILPVEANSGTVRLRYQYLAGTCNAQTTQQFSVIEVANLNLGIISPNSTDLNANICFTPGADNALRLEGVPAGGTFTLVSGPNADLSVVGPGIIDFNPSGAGNYVVRYSVVNGSCVFSKEQELRFVVPAFPANFLNIADNLQFCIGQGQQTINFGLSNPGTGNTGRVLDEEGNEITTYSGPGNYPYAFDLSPARTFRLVYEVAEEGGCTTRDTINVEILPGILATVRYASLNKEATSDTFCKDMNLQLPLAVDPPGGNITPQIISGQQVITFSGGTWHFRPWVTGQHVFLYTGVQPGTGCTFSRVFVVTVADPDDAQPVSLTTAGNQTTFGVNQGAVQLFGSPMGGTFSGPGVTGNVFNPNAAGIGTHFLTYTVTQGSCPTSASITVTVNDGAAPPCTFPANINVVPSANGAVVSWSAVPGATSYQVQYRKVGTVTWTPRNVSATFTSVTLTGLELGATYEYRIRTTCAGNIISPMSPVSTFTTVDVPQCLPPATISVNNTTTNSATVNFSAPAGGIPPANYEITLRFGTGSPNAGQTVGDPVVIDAGQSLSHTFTGLAPNTNYVVEIRTNCLTSFSQEVRTAVFSTLPDVSACAAPTGLTVGAITETGAVASWGAVAGATEYLFALEPGIGEVSGEVGATTATLSNLSPGTTYTFRVKALCANGESDFASTTFTTAGTGAGCSTLAPSISSISLQATQITVRWGRVEGATGYRVEYRLFGTSAFTALTVPATAEITQSATITGLTPSTRYEVRVTALCPGGNSAPSVIRRFQTLSAGKSGEVEITFDDNVSVYPNPSRGLFNLAFNAAWESQVKATIFDLTGRILMTQTFDVVEGHNVVDVDATRLGAGLYILKFDSDTHSQTVKISVQ